MPIIVNQIKSPLNVQEGEVISRALKMLGVSRQSVLEAKLYKTSLDARKRDNIHNVHAVFVRLTDVAQEKKLCEKNTNFSYAPDGIFEPVIAKEKLAGRVVIAGFGPAGMFCGLALAEQGYKPLILERGEMVEDRAQTVERFWKTGELDESSNVQFGEGGAGTFSDGKLTTRIKDPLCRYVLERMAQLGAPEEILTKAKPHVGTDRLRGLVRAVRERIIACGGEIRFSSQLTDVETDGSKAVAAVVDNDKIEISALVLAIGHSARDTFEMLARKGIFLEPKPFSVGARIEHTQAAVDESLYGEHRGDPLLPKGEYQLSYREKSGRAAYTFCMCPGGTVVPAASEKGGVVTNGMSVYARDGKNANSALVVSVTPEDFGKGALDAMYFARSIERKAYELTGGYSACGTTVKGFLEGKASLDSPITPTYALGLREVELGMVFPEQVTKMMKRGLQDMSRKMKCFGDGNAILSAPETRTSSPVRITRDPMTLTSVSCDRLYPCGEGAGYAGGIMSAAVDGIKTALKIMELTAP